MPTEVPRCQRCNNYEDLPFLVEMGDGKVVELCYWCTYRNGVENLRRQKVVSIADLQRMRSTWWED